MTDKFCKDCKWLKDNNDMRAIWGFAGIPFVQYCTNPNNTYKNMVNGNDMQRYPPNLLRSFDKDGECGKEGRWFELNGNAKS